MVERGRMGRPAPGARAALAAAPESLLVTRARAGDAGAFGELVRRYMRRGYFAALGITGSPDDARDLSQEAFIRAYRARGRLDPGRPFYPWLYRILRRLCLNFLRDRSARARKLREAGGWLAEETHGRPPADPGRSLESATLRRRIAAAIEELPPEQRETIVLREFEGLRYREIAELLEIPIGTVMSRLYAARRKLAARLEER
jgi:RNA polymerase sigma-70 factor (ECF subfamily)